MEFVDKYLPMIQEGAITYGLLFLKAIVIFVIGRWIAKIIVNIVDRLLQRSGMDDMLVKFLKNIIYALLLTFVVIAAISALGIQTASLVAVIGAAGLAIGLALQGSLSNFAAGVLMIIFRPYKLGDLVEVAGINGFVEEVDVFTTTLRTPDKTKIIIPNGQIMNAEITNYTEAEDRRLDLEVGIGYGDDIDSARRVLMDAVKASEYVLDEPAPKVSVASLGDSSVNLAVRPWVKSATYAPASHEVTERIKKALDAAGISIPFPQRDVHMYSHQD
ncbi:MAG: mechanosensitive ion channel [Gammaproteobacteria bacterium]|nr:mechanosensitive ion channel [Gammaproteobacteria bacterium]MBT8105966.1 mechanosensitive ion channel [Gammaproteobacteria bacterium]NNF49304.1 mechanosensitive ion channel [Woeseiaceae bacterium]NNK25979.1 mechanosensitive ion channel [Woeseiaceae bacterium]NNL62867.1 mechanosensitive ion channel [Woeseiaceae bacterium]